MRMTWKNRAVLAGAAAAGVVTLTAGMSQAATTEASWDPANDILSARDLAQDGHSAVAQISIGGTIRATVWAPNGVGSVAGARVSVPAGYSTGSVRACIGDINVGASSIRGCTGWSSVSL